ncbi:MAG TPA: hypothetical protein VNV41_06520 [Candidatus Acidoferrales bacterium]|nr:hypothetical protein [Candidatus Acidoferrales bacterium]
MTQPTHRDGRFEITPDGKTIHITVYDMLQNTTTTAPAAKQ